MKQWELYIRLLRRVILTPVLYYIKRTSKLVDRKVITSLNFPGNTILSV